MITKQIASVLITAFKHGKKALICGNGGSATLADHMAGEFVGKFKRLRKSLPAISLTNPGMITAIGNDYGFDKVFVRQIEAYGKSGDVLITMSTSGNSNNIFKAQLVGASMGMIVIPFPTNQETGKDTAGTQEIHLQMIHEICELVEKEFIT